MAKSNGDGLKMLSLGMKKSFLFGRSRSSSRQQISNRVHTALYNINQNGHSPNLHTLLNDIVKSPYISQGEKKAFVNDIMEASARNSRRVTMEMANIMRRKNTPQTNAEENAYLRTLLDNELRHLEHTIQTTPMTRQQMNAEIKELEDSLVLLHLELQLAQEEGNSKRIMKYERNIHAMETNIRLLKNKRW